MSKRIEDMFRNYRQKRRDLSLLQGQLQRMMKVDLVSDDEVIRSMVFSTPDGDHVHSSDISDKTAKIAMCLREEQDRMLADMIAPVTRKIHALRYELQLFDYAVVLLPDRLPDVVRCLVKNGDDWDSTMRELNISRRTLQRDRRTAIDELERMYQLFDSGGSVG